MPRGSTRCRSTSSRRPSRASATSSTSCRSSDGTTGRVFATRMGKIPAALEATRRRCSSPASAGRSRRAAQVEACAEQSRDLTADDGYFAKIVADATVGDEPLESELAAALPRPRRPLGGIRRDGRLGSSGSCCRTPPRQTPAGVSATPSSRATSSAHGRPRGDLPLGPAGGREPPRPDERDRRRARSRRQRRPRRRDPRCRREVPAARTTPQGLDAGARRRGHRRPQGRALRHPGRCSASSA